MVLVFRINSCFLFVSWLLLWSTLYKKKKMSAAVFVTCSFPTDHLTALYIWLCYQKWLQLMKLLLLNCSATLTRGTPVYLLLTICFTSLFPASVALYFYTCFFFKSRGSKSRGKSKALLSIIIMKLSCNAEVRKGRKWVCGQHS